MGMMGRDADDGPATSSFELDALARAPLSSITTSLLLTLSTLIGAALVKSSSEMHTNITILAAKINVG